MKKEEGGIPTQDQVSAGEVAFRRGPSEPEARWVGLDEALDLLAFKGERAVVEQARTRIEAEALGDT